MESAGMVLLPRQSQGGNQNAGSNRNAQGSSVSAFVSTLVPVFILASVLFLVFLLLRKKFPRIYSPRCYLGSLREWQRSPQQSAGILGWRKEYKRLQDEFLIGHASLDNYLWVRFFRMLATTCFVGCVITWPILFPVNATGSNDAATGLDILSFSHITPGPRYYAQVFVSWLFMAWIMFFIARECRFFVRLRQHYYLSPYQRSRISSRTVLFVNVPEEARFEDHFRKEFTMVRSVWFHNAPDDFIEKVEDRDNAATKLEDGEVKLLKNHAKRQMKSDKKGAATSDASDGRDSRISVHEKDRPSHRLPKLKFLPIGQKVDTVQWARGELRRLIPEVEQGQMSLKNNQSEFRSSCFVEFETVQAAHAAMEQCGTKNKMSLTPKELGPEPESIIWKNLVKPFWKVQLMNILCTAFVAFLCLFWSIPVAVIGAISNINYLTNEVPFLSFITQIPSVILGVVTGLLPVVLLAVLMALVPIVLMILARLFEPTESLVQMKVQAWYFPFQVIQVFLITTFASGAASVATQIVANPSSAVSLLAENLPKASNFYISYFVLYGLLMAASQLLNLVPLLLFLILGKILDKSPRKMFNRYVSLAGIGWGSLYPKFTNLGVIALAYSSIAPLVLGFAAVGFLFMYFAFRYNALFTLGTPVSTRGNTYARAMQQLITGIYISELCLIGLFAIGTANTIQSVGPLVLEIVLLVATIGWHLWLNRSLSKMESEMPETQMAQYQRHGPFLEDNMEKTGNAEVAMPMSTERSADEMAQKTAPGQNGRSKDEAERRGGWMTRIKGYLHPDTSAYNAAQLVASSLSNAGLSYSHAEHEEAYAHPAATSECPIIWIPQDKYGLSKQEKAEIVNTVGKGITVADDAAWIDDKGKVTWNEEPRSAPIWEEPIAY